MAPTHKPVQDIIQSGGVPKCYIQHKDDYQAANSNGLPPLMDAPTIDFSLLSSSSYPDDELANLRIALLLLLGVVFRTILDEYSKGNRMILEMLLKAMASSLNIEDKSFLELWGDENKDMTFARFNFYPRCPMSDQVVGLKPHGDGTYITMLLLDKEVEGLQVNKDNTWFRVPIIPQALTILVGDQMETAGLVLATQQGGGSKTHPAWLSSDGRSIREQAASRFEAATGTVEFPAGLRGWALRMAARLAVVAAGLRQVGAAEWLCRVLVVRQQHGRGGGS
uniref:Fe2OG dioxygenase domain-containing protein n=1 Tax=Chenopodium quinoa TaxID=63459 RepID=A0A803L2Z6_CHEQI